MTQKAKVGFFAAFGLGILILAIGLVIVVDNIKTIQSTRSPATNPKMIEQQSNRADLNRALMRAAADGDLIIVTDLVAKGADINFTDSYGWTPLIQASMMNRLDVVKYLVVKGAEVNAVGEDGTNALQNAVIFDHVAMVKFLIARGADLTLRGKYGWDARETATRRDRKKVLNYLEHEDLLRDDDQKSAAH